MNRVENNYSWNTIEDWIKAQEMGLVEIGANPQKDENYKMENLINMAEQNCFPLQMVCYQRGDKKYLALDPLMKKFWHFVHNEISVLVNSKKEHYFKDFPVEKQDKILRAAINSVWIELL